MNAIKRCNGFYDRGDNIYISNMVNEDYPIWEWKYSKRIKRYFYWNRASISWDKLKDPEVPEFVKLRILLGG